MAKEKKPRNEILYGWLSHLEIIPDSRLVKNAKDISYAGTNRGMDQTKHCLKKFKTL